MGLNQENNEKEDAQLINPMTFYPSLTQDIKQDTVLIIGGIVPLNLITSALAEMKEPKTWRF